MICAPSDHLQESPGPKSQKRLKKTFLGSAKRPRSQKIPRKPNFGHFVTFSVDFGTEGPETPENARSGFSCLILFMFLCLFRGPLRKFPEGSGTQSGAFHKILRKFQIFSYSYGVCEDQQLKGCEVGVLLTLQKHRKN